MFSLIRISIISKINLRQNKYQKAKKSGYEKDMS